MFFNSQGRNGKGSIFVFANGNGALFNGTCSYDEYVSSIYTIGISVVTGKNVGSRQNVKCPGVSAVAYARDGSLGVSNPDDLMVSMLLWKSCFTMTDRTQGFAPPQSFRSWFQPGSLRQVDRVRLTVLGAREAIC